MSVNATWSKGAQNGHFLAESTVKVEMDLTTKETPSDGDEGKSNFSFLVSAQKKVEALVNFFLLF